MATAEEKDKKGPEKKGKRETYVTFNSSMRELLLTIFIDVVKNKELISRLCYEHAAETSGEFQCVTHMIQTHTAVISIFPLLHLSCLTTAVHGQSIS